MPSKKTKKEQIIESPPVVPVVFNQTTKYGVRGSFGYLPSSFADAWIKKGVASLAIEHVTKPKKKTKPVKDDEGIITIVNGDESLRALKIEVDDEVDSEGKP